MAVPIVMSSADPGAPVLDATPASFYNVMKKCLIEGYGTQAALGWSLIFDDPTNNQMVVRPASATAELRIAAQAGTVPTFRFLGAAAFGSIRSPINAIQGGSVFFTAYSNQALAKWFVVGDASRFYLILTDPSKTSGNMIYGYSHYAYFFGDADSGVLADPGRFVVLTYSDGSATELYYGAPQWHYVSPLQSAHGGGTNSVSPAHVRVSKSTGGDVSGRWHSIALSGGSEGSASNPSFTINPESSHGFFPLFDAYICARRTQNSDHNASPTWPLFRLRLPGLKVLPISIDAPPGSLINLLGMTGVGITENNGYGISRFVRTDEW